MRLPDAPRVVVLLVATDGAPWLGEALEGLRAQDHRPLDALAVDNASTDDSMQVLHRALGAARVVRLERRVGYGRALAAGLKVAAERDLQADAFLLIHDDTVLAPGALTEMLRILAEPDVGIVGCKLLEWDDERVLQDVGLTADRYGRSVPQVEKGEIDQGQHDGVRPVLAVQSAAMLISRDVVERVGLFDLRFEMLRDDIDLCWRARLAGFTTAITTYASARHAAASMRELRASPARRAQRFVADRNMIAMLVKNYGLLRLAYALPITVVISLMNALLFFATGRRRASLQVVRALSWNVRHLPSSLAARRRTQRLRRSPDRQVTALMHHGTTRLQQQVSHVLDALAGDAGGVDDDPDAPPRRFRDRVRAHPGIAIAIGVGIVALLAARPLFFEGPLAGADMPPFPASGRALLRAFVSGWRGPGDGGAGPATPGLALLGGLSSLLFGSTWLAARVVLVALPVAGALGVARLASTLGLRTWSARLAGALYGLSPLVLGALDAGRLHDLAVMAGMPLVVLLVVRASGLAPPAAPFAAIAGVMVTASLGPWLLAAAVPIGAVVAAATRTRAPISAAVRAVVIALALLFPWSVELFRPATPILAGGSEPLRGMTDLLASAAGASTVPRALSYGVAAAAAVGFLVAPRSGRRVASVAGALAMAGLAVAWAVERQIPLAPRAALPLTLTAIGAVILASIAAETIPPRLAERTFGVAHVAAGLVGVALAFQGLAGLAWIVGGERDGIRSGSDLLPATFASDQARVGAYRVLWLRGDRAQPRYDLTGPAGESMVSYLARKDGDGADALARAVTAIAGGGTTSGGRLLATFGVRYVVLRPGTADGLAEAFGGQVDLGFVQQVRGAAILANDAALPIAAGVRATGWIRAAAGGLDDVAGAESSPTAGRGFVQTDPARYRGAPGKTRWVFLAEDFSTRWRLHAGGRAIRARPSFGWATRFPLPAVQGGLVTIRWAGQGRHRALLTVELILVLLFAGAWHQSRGRNEP